MNPSNATITSQILTISRSDRWSLSRRLEELHIPCTCHTDGTFSVEVASPLQLLQFWSVLQQMKASRSDLLDWLERCWQVCQ